MKFILKAIDDQATISHEFDAPNISELIDRIEAFIKASGFVYDGYLQIIEDSDAKGEG